MEGTRRAREPVLNGSRRRLGEIMNTTVVTVEPKESARVAWSRLRRRGIRHLVVMENGRLRGVISERDLGGGSGAEIREGRMVEDLMTPRVVSAESKTTLHEAADCDGNRSAPSP